MKPIDMLLFCPVCAMQHIDAPETACDWPDCGYDTNCVQGHSCCKDKTHWMNPPHRSHLCHSCGHIWRPADVPTNGVASIATKGERDGSPVPAALKGGPLGYIEQEVFDDLIQQKPWTAGAQNVFNQRKVGRYTVPIYGSCNAGVDYLPPQPGEGVSDNPYCNDADCNEPNSRAMRWHRSVMQLTAPKDRRGECLAGGCAICAGTDTPTGRGRGARTSTRSNP